MDTLPPLPLSPPRPRAPWFGIWSLEGCSHGCVSEQLEASMDPPPRGRGLGPLEGELRRAKPRSTLQPPGARLDLRPGAWFSGADHKGPGWRHKTRRPDPAVLLNPCPGRAQDRVCRLECQGCKGNSHSSFFFLSF